VFYSKKNKLTSWRVSLVPEDRVAGYVPEVNVAEIIGREKVRVGVIYAYFVDNNCFVTLK
jgi:hypothetical protein